jgi:hypothetical protein
VKNSRSLSKSYARRLIIRKESGKGTQRIFSQYSHIHALITHSDL